MRYRNLLLAVTFLVPCRLPAEVLPPPGGGRDYSALPVNPVDAVVLERRLELEFRRAGGPRRDAVADLLKAGERVATLDWGRFVIRACQERLVDCSGYVEAAVERSRTASPELHRWAESRVKGIRQEAAIQALPSKTRQELYAKALRQGDARAGDVRVVAGDAVWRATREGMAPLVTSSDAAAALRLAETQPVLRAEIELARALSTQDPGHALLELVARDTEHDATRVGDMKQGEPAAARMALAELRRLNPAGAADELKRILTEATRNKAAHAAAENSLRGAGSSGNLVLDIAEVVGDLGDREFERRMLGGRTLWDQVNDVEEALAKSGKIPRSAMVASSGK
jgi:hypothetical protein